MRARHIAVFALLGLIWGSEWLATRALDVPLLAGVAVRYAIGAVVLWAWIVVGRIRLPRLRLLMVAAVTGVTFLGLPVILSSWASARISPGLLVVVLAMTPLIAALLEGRASGAVLSPLVGGVGGIALLASQGLSFSAAQWAGALAMLAAATLIAGSVAFIKRRLAEIPSPVLGAVQLAAGGACLAVASGAAELDLAFVWNWKSACLEVGLGILGGAVALQLYYWLLRRMESLQLTASQWIATVAGVAESVALVRSAPSWRIPAGAAIALASLWVLLQVKPDEDAPLTIKSTFPNEGR